jgi:hypothetical protein
MKTCLGRFAATIGAFAFLIAPSLAADGLGVIKVALLDMTSVMSPGFMGFGIMGQGMGGLGLMGPGMMGPGMMGQGMMGPGMMGMMSLRTDRASIKSGSVKFEVMNWSRSLLHEVIIVAVDNPNAPLPYNYAEARIAEDQIKVVAEVADLQPNASGTIDVSLAPG